MRRSVLLALFLLFVYILSYSGNLHSIDELATVAVTESLLNATLQVNRMEWEQWRTPPQNAYAIDDNLYSKKGLGSSLILMPLFFVGKLWSSVGAIQLATLSTSLITALTVFVFFHLVLALGFDDRVATIASLALGLGTLLWPYSKWLFSEPLAALGLCLALLGLVRFSGQHRAPWLLVCGSGLSILTLSRSANAVIALPFVLIIGYKLVRSRPRSATNGVLYFAISLGIGLLIVILYNYARFGSPFSFPRSPGEDFTTSLGTGVSGMLWSSGKGLFWYVPLALMGLVSLAVTGRQLRASGYAAAIASIIALLLFYGRWYDWPGGQAWGPRFLVPAMPAVVMLCLPACAWLMHSSGPIWRKWLLGAWLSLSILVQILGVLKNFQYQELLEGSSGTTYQELLWSWRHSPLLTYWGKLFNGADDPIWLHPFFWANSPKLLAFIGLLVLAIVSVHLFLARGPRDTRKKTQASWLFVLGLLTILLGTSMVKASYSDPRWWEQSDSFASNELARNWVANQSVNKDIVLLELRLGYDMSGRISEWVNYYPLKPDYLGWLRKTPPASEDQERLREWLLPYGRVFLSLQAIGIGDPTSTTENWLRLWAYEGQNEWLDSQRIVEFVLPKANGTILANGAVDWLLSDPLRLEYAVHQGLTPRHLLIDLDWSGFTDPGLRFSVQVLESTGNIVRQVDRPPSVNSDHPDRVGIYLHDPESTLVLRLYDAPTGNVYPGQTPDDQPADLVIIIGK